MTQDTTQHDTDASETESILRGRSAKYFTLGCKLNFAETAAMEKRLEAVGVRRALKTESADICIVNTCSVTEVADSKCRQAIHKLVRQNPGAVVVVTGCYAQLKPKEVADIDGVSFLLGQNDKATIADRIALYIYKVKNSAKKNDIQEPTQSDADCFVPSCARGERTRFFLKVQDGCNYFCTYCTIPFARGRSRNGSIESLVKQACEAAVQGGREIVLTGVNIGDFGRTTGENFIDLLKALDEVEGISRYRISSIEPNLLTDEVLQFCASSRAFMPHFHIPLQAGSDEVLRLMHRRYDTQFFRDKIYQVKQLLPDAFIGIDVIVGTRGETDELFNQSLAFVESLPVSQLHVFPYSERPGTAALRIPHSVSPQEKHRRCNTLIEISNSKLAVFYEKFIGKERTVLVEHSGTNGVYHGFTDNYIRVELRSALPHLDNQLISCRLTGWNESHNALIAEIR